MTTVELLLGAGLPLVPLFFALLGLVSPQHSREIGVSLGVLGALAALAIAAALLVLLDGPVQGSVQIAEFGDLPVTVGVRIDLTAVIVAVAVAAVALAVQVYSITYLKDDDRYGAYAAQVGLFTAAMLTVVVANDLIMLLVGWEVMGICSYLLIGHDRRLPEAPKAAVKAFLVTRVGDIGFLLGIVIAGLHAGSFQLVDVLRPGALSPTVATTVCVLLLCGVAGKSAQFPLHTWLPDAMAGPTPISALIHAATMVAAGVYVVARLFDPLFTSAPAARWVLAAMAVITMPLGALAALGQDDIKRVLAWSTVSQIAYMIGALSIGAPHLALNYLLAHAAFKALLFLGAGVVIHAVGANTMSRMGDLRRTLPTTFWTMTIGLGALIGLPPLAGFFSKDEILFAASQGYGALPMVVFLSGLFTVFVTGLYATLLWLRVFFGPAQWTGRPHAGQTRSGRPREAYGTMRWPVILLAIPSAGLGFVAMWDPFAKAVGAPAGETFAPHLAALAPLPFAALGMTLGWWLWHRDPARQPVAWPAFTNGFYLDRVQNLLVVRPVTALAAWTRRADKSIVDGAVVGTGHGVVEVGAWMTLAHRAGTSRALTAVITGAALLGAAAVLIVGAGR